MSSRFITLVMLVSGLGCQAYSNALERPEPAVRLTLHPDFGARGQKLFMDLVFEGAAPLTDSGSTSCYYTALDFGPNIGTVHKSYLEGCVGVQVQVIIGAEAKIGIRKVQLRMRRGADVLEGFADFYVGSQ